MRCHSCTDYFDEDRQNVICPHIALDRPLTPAGGHRLPQDLRVSIDEAFRVQDLMLLYRFMGHNNPAVRLYAREMSDALDMIAVYDRA